MKNTQNRPPPAYQEYPASMLSNAYFRAASLAARGLLYQLRLECWENQGRVPSDLKMLAKYLAVDYQAVSSHYAEIQSFFHSENGYLHSAELDDYRKYLDNRRAQQSEGGKRGAAISNAGRVRVTRNSSVQDSRVESNTTQVNEVTNAAEDSEHKAWIDEYDSA